MRYRKPLVCNIFVGFFFAVTASLNSSCSTPEVTEVPASTQGIRSERAVNINSASADEIERIPGIGPKLAAEIVRFRLDHGPFHRPEQLLLLHGMSDRRYREISIFVKTE